MGLFMQNYIWRIVRLFQKSRSLIIFITLVFICGLAAGYLLFMFNPELATNLSHVVIDKFERMDEEMQEMTMVGRINLIFFNNLRVVLIMILLGLFIGLPPLAIVFFNGLFIGIISGMISGSESLFQFLAVGVLPHGIFELPAFIMGAVIGVRLGVSILIIPGDKMLFKRVKMLLEEIILALSIIIPLLFIAAVVEMTITSELVQMLFSDKLIVR